MQMRGSGSQTASHAARHVAALAVIILSWTLGSAGAKAVEVSRQTTLSHSPDAVWAMIGEFGTIDRWHPAIETSVVEGDGGNGIYRTLTLGDGGMIRELLLDYSLRDRRYSYAILESPLPVANYVSNLAVTPGPDRESAIVTWSSTFDANGVSDQEAADLIGGIYQAGFDSIARMLGTQ
jgi:mxaD protein